MNEIKRHPAFEVYSLNKDAIDKCNKVRDLFDNFFAELENLMPQGRYLSIVVTKLEEASFFVKKGISVDKSNHKEA